MLQPLVVLVPHRLEATARLVAFVGMDEQAIGAPVAGRQCTPEHLRAGAGGLLRGPTEGGGAEQVATGTYSTESYWGGMDDGVVALAELSPQVDAETAALVENYQTKILTSDWDVFCGPVKGQNGELSVAVGSCVLNTPPA